jgi:porphobilinogen synthase
MVRQSRLHVADLVQPLFVCPGQNRHKPIAAMPGNAQMSIDKIVTECLEIQSLGIKAVLLFGIPEKKDENGLVACDEKGIIQQALQAIRNECKNLLLITDVCNCEYTTHGHCGPLVDGDVHNDKTIEFLAKQALSHARAGAHMVAPSDMMDGRVAKIRDCLDKNGFEKIPILSYAAKFSSAFYGPFREAAESAPAFGDRKTYQMDTANAGEALREVALDIEEGADIIMVKPALSYLDVIHRVKSRFHVPVAAYNVSGEFSMVKAASEKGWVDETAIMLEILTSIKRAGADIIITYHARQAARLLTG